MDTIVGMRTFEAVVVAGSFTQAAGRLDVSPQLVSKYVNQIESRLGVRLLNRSTRHLSLTEAGRIYYERCRQLLADFDKMESIVSQSIVKVQGKLRISAPMSFGTMHLTCAIAKFMTLQPEISIDLVLDDRKVDIIGEGFDLAIRIGTLQESSLVARKLAPVRMVVCGAPDYFERLGVPETPAQLADHDCLQYDYWSEQGQWSFERNGEIQHVAIKGTFSANNGNALRVAAIAGRGIIFQPTFIVGEDIQAGRLQKVLSDYRLQEVNVYAVYPHRQYLSAKVRTFVDYLTDYFSPTQWGSSNLTTPHQAA